MPTAPVSVRRNNGTGASHFSRQKLCRDFVRGATDRGQYRQVARPVVEALTVLRSDWPFVPVPANVLRLRISVVRPVDKLIRRFDPVANGVELTIQFVVRIYGHN